MLLAATVHGRVMIDSGPLPGAVVSIGTAKTVTDGKGYYTLRGVSTGRVDLKYELAGYNSDRTTITVHDGDNDAGDVTLPPAKAEVITVACAAAPCSANDPESEWDTPACRDYELDTALEQSLRNGDDSARSLLQSRFDNTSTISERQRIGGMLLKHVADDSRYWDELMRRAEDLVRFGADDDATRAKLDAYCKEHGLDPSGYESAMWDAFQIVSDDPRSRPLMMRLLQSADPSVVSCAIVGLARQHDEKSLPDIDTVLQRLPKDDAAMVAQALALFNSDAADAVAQKYLDVSGALYLDLKKQGAERR